MSQGKPTDVTVKEVKVSFEPVQYRTPLKFGGRVVSSSYLINADVTVEARNGKHAMGHGSMPVGNVWAWPSATLEPDQTESLTDAIIASLKGNPEIQISLAQQDDARYGVDEARANYLPRIDVTGAWGREFARNIPQAPTQRFRSEATIALNQNLWDFGVTINDIKRARASYRSAQWGTRERIEAISYDIANAYLGVLLQQNLVSLAEGEIASVKKILRIVTVQKDLGLTTPADVERAQTRLDNVRSQLLDRQSALEQARNAYKRLTNHMPLRAAEVPAAGTALPESADVAVDMIDTRSPRLAQAVEDRRSLDKQYDSQADTALPRLGLTIASDYRQDVLGSTGRAVDARAMVTFSYRLYNGGAATATRACGAVMAASISCTSMCNTINHHQATLRNCHFQFSGLAYYTKINIDRKSVV